MGQLIHRALIVDDEPAIREATSRAMSALSFSCETVGDGRQALQSYRKQRHDLVVTDLRMPEFHGHSLILELLKEREPPSIVVLTGVANTKLVMDLFSRGVQDIVHKPVDFHVFAAKMLSQVERSQWNSALGHGQKIRPQDSHTELIAKIETALELFALCIPPDLDRELSDNRDLLNDPSTNIVQFLERLAKKRQRIPDRRQAPRLPLFSSAVAIPVNKNFVPQGEASTVTFSDLSEGGACFFHTRTFHTEYVALCWQSLVSSRRYLKAVLQVRRCKPLGPFYELAGPFVMHDS